RASGRGSWRAGPAPPPRSAALRSWCPSSVGAYEPPVAWTDAATGPDLRSSIRLTGGGSGGPRGFERRHERPEGGKVATATDGGDLAGAEVVERDAIGELRHGTGGPAQQPAERRRSDRQHGDEEIGAPAPERARQPPCFDRLGECARVRDIAAGQALEPEPVPR